MKNIPYFVLYIAWVLSFRGALEDCQNETLDPGWVYVGGSPDHVSDVALVLNPRIGLILPHYHVIFDDTFSTLCHLKSEAACLIGTIWLNAVVIIILMIQRIQH